MCDICTRLQAIVENQQQQIADLTQGGKATHVDIDVERSLKAIGYERLREVLQKGTVHGDPDSVS